MTRCEIFTAILLILAINASVIYGISVIIDHQDQIVDMANDYLDLSEGE